MFRVPQIVTDILKPKRFVEPISFSVIDVETDGLYPYAGNKIFAYILTHDSGEKEIWRVDGKDGKDPALAWKRLQEFYDDITISKIAHNLKFDHAMIKMAGIRIPDGTIYQDTMIISRILRNWAPSHELGFLAWELMGEIELSDGTKWTREDDERIHKLAMAYGGYHKVPVIEMEHYQEADGMRTLLLFLTWYDDIKNDPAQFSDYRNEIDLIITTQATEEFGVRIDRHTCKKLITWMQDEVDSVRDETWRTFGEYINWNADAQIRRILYDRLKLPVTTLTDTGKPSTDKDTLLYFLENNPNPAVPLILKHRSYDDGISIIKSYMELADENGIIHPSFNTNQAHTGRQSASRPNVQNLRKETVLKNPYPVPARKCFWVRPGYLTYFVDYAGIEMRLIVGACGEKELIDVIAQNGDVHALAAESFFLDIWSKRDVCFKHFLTNDPDLKKEFRKLIEIHGQDLASEMLYKKCKKTLRSAAKNAAFAKAYGAGITKVALTLNLSKELAGPGFETYCARFPKVAGFTRTMIGEVKEFGYVKTAFGRKLHIPKNKAYIGSNYRIQGDAAGVLKRAENRTFKYSNQRWDSEIKIENKVHDELILAARRYLEQHENEFCSDIRKLMISIPEIAVPLDVEWKKTFTNWNDTKEFQPKYMYQ